VSRPQPVRLTQPGVRITACIDQPDCMVPTCKGCARFRVPLETNRKQVTPAPLVTASHQHRMFPVSPRRLQWRVLLVCCYSCPRLTPHQPLVSAAAPQTLTGSPAITCPKATTNFSFAPHRHVHTAAAEEAATLQPANAHQHPLRPPRRINAGPAVSGAGSHTHVRAASSTAGSQTPTR
jgi:hypothetical protein